MIKLCRTKQLFYLWFQGNYLLQQQTKQPEMQVDSHEEKKDLQAQCFECLYTQFLTQVNPENCSGETELDKATRTQYMQFM